MIEKQNKIPDNSILKNDEKSFHYVDSFQSQDATIRPDNDVISIGKLFLTSGPGWADRLMSIRDKAVGVVGLKTAGQLTSEAKNPDNFKFQVGEQLGIFKLYAKTGNELVLGDDDKHLSFRVSLLLDGKKKIMITTAVEYKNVFGRIYFLPVKPIHQLIVKGTLREIIRKLENETAENLQTTNHR
ncbi:DUF2867 domain-containing protein [Maribellus luteus]|uniref:DUF2867 domain-containing protein n=1 Tax=Maribellus luteus TaxID=2305463 RepID=A0A399SRB8_9BACT|nr:DUF2867 domain-containing protein [Maribellus luteus]RIJ45439.1 DUF2867 domain-containing protein [Maribellus luteus]